MSAKSTILITMFAVTRTYFRSNDKRIGGHSVNTPSIEDAKELHTKWCELAKRQHFGGPVNHAIIAIFTPEGVLAAYEKFSKS